MSPASGDKRRPRRLLIHCWSQFRSTQRLLRKELGHEEKNTGSGFVSRRVYARTRQEGLVREDGRQAQGRHWSANEAAEYTKGCLLGENEEK